MFKIPILKATFLFAFLNEFFLRLVKNYPNNPYKMLAFIFLYSSSILLIVNIRKSLRKNINIPLYFRFIIFLLFGWSFFTIVRCLNTNMVDMVTLFTNYQVGLWAWITPMAIFFGLNASNWIKLFSLSIWFLRLGIGLALIDIFFDKNLSGSAPLTFFAIFSLTYYYHPRNLKRLTILAAFMYIWYHFFFQSVRSGLIFYLLIIFFSFLEFLRNKSVNIYKKLILVMVAFSISIFILLSSERIYDSVVSDEKLTTDTRTFLFVELFADTSRSERWIGRGALGRYFSPYFHELKESGNESGDAADRITVEVGFLHIILKGGYIMVLLYLLILVPAAYLGIFRSNNVLARLSGYYIFSIIIMFFVVKPPEYGILFILLWMAVGTAISPSIRKLKNQDIMKEKNGKLILK